MRRRIFLGSLTVLLVIIVGVSLSISGREQHLVLGESIEVMPTTAPLIISATADDQGVTVNWQPSQDGNFPVHAYQIFHKNADGQFEQIGEVGAALTQYLDSSGKEGDVYKLTSSDNQQPANISQYSDETTAAAVPVAVASTIAPITAVQAPTDNSTAVNNSFPADNSTTTDQSNLSVTPTTPTPTPTPSPSPTSPSPSVSIISPPIPLPAPQVSPNYVPPDLPVNVNPQDVVVNNLLNLTKNFTSLPSDTKAPVDDLKVQQVQKSVNLQVVQLETVIVTAKEPLIQPILSQYNNQTQQLYQHFSQLSDSQKTTTKKACQQQTTTLETSLLNLPEQYQMDLFIGLAHCHLINNQP